MTLMIRSTGPSLTAFGISGVLPDPKLKLDSGNTVVARDDSWQGHPQVVAMAAQVGAFSWSATVADSALLVTLPPGAYTAQIAGASGDTGVALVEICEVS